MSMEQSRPSSSNIFPEFRLAHELLDGLEGLEIGPTSHNPFRLKTRNVGLTADRDPDDYEFFKQSQLEMCGSFATIDISADAADIPVPENSTDFVLHSHVWEHLPNPLVALDDWVRITRFGGYLFVIVPKRDTAASDKDRPVTSAPSLVQLYERKRRGETFPPGERGRGRGHYTVFSPGLLREIGDWFNQSHSWAGLDEVAFQETDAKVGNGHTIVWQVKKYSALSSFGSACLRSVKAVLSGRRTSDRRGF
jgi:SAM-dependent methyltransferase